MNRAPITLEQRQRRQRRREIAIDVALAIGIICVAMVTLYGCWQWLTLLAGIPAPQDLVL